MSRKKGSLTATGGDSDAVTLRDPYCPDEVAQFLERFAVKRVVDPSTLPAIREKADVFQSLEMERQARLAGVKRAGQVANTLFTICELVKDTKACLIGERVEDAGRSFSVSCHR